MILRALFKLLGLLLLLTLGWTIFKQPAVQAWIWPQQNAPKPLVFDNGTVRQMPEAASASGSQALPPGRMRRCQRGSDTRYTDQPCPPGFRELSVGGVVNVMNAPPVAASAASASAARKNLYDVLDLNGRDELMQKRVDRSVEQATR